MEFYIDALKLIISKSYWEGFAVVPIILMSYVFQGVYFNLSIWYKLTDKTMYGAYFSVLGAIITVVIIVVFVPMKSSLYGGYMGAAWSSFFCYLIIMIISYFYGQKYFPIKYELKRIGWYFLISIVLYFANELLSTPYAILNYTLRTLVLFGFIYYILKKENLLNKIPNISSIKKQH
jgi:O-antigen/teichoic acid export membrane protein